MSDEEPAYRECHQRQGDARASLEELFLLAEQACRGYGSAVSTQQLMRTERDTLAQYAEQTGIGTDAASFRSRLESLGYEWHRGGNEHDVFIPPSGARVLKITKTPNGYGAKSQLTDYLENLLLSNIILGDDIQLEFIVYGDNEMPHLVISQPYIEGEKAEVAAIRDFWRKLDFLPCGVNAYRHACGTLVGDARPDNIFQAPDGDIFPFDVQILHGERYLRYMLLNALSRYTPAHP